jgi:hypothetical protein
MIFYLFHYSHIFVSKFTMANTTLVDGYKLSHPLNGKQSPKKETPHGGYKRKEEGQSGERSSRLQVRSFQGIVGVQ